ncbi:MAG: PP2C family protein-serine/threonine phosphatase [Phycisphaerae bacterium]
MTLVRLVTQPLQRLVAAVDRIGRGDFEGDIFEIYNSREMAVLSSAINIMRAALAGAQRADHQRIAKARRIQQHLLPIVPTRSEQIACEYKPAAMVGGDYFDFQILSGGTMIACVADVSGHGVPAAISAAMLKTLFIATISRTSDPAEALTLMNAGFTQVALEEDFASIILVHLDPAARRLQYASAGQETRYLLRALGPVEMLNSTGGLLGLVTTAQWTSRVVPINPGDRIILVTDGLSETADPDGMLFGRQRVHDVLEANFQEPLNVVACRLLDAVEFWRQAGVQMDDVTVLAIAVV